MLSLKTFHKFSTKAVHSPICIVGAGAGGINILGHLSRQKGFMPHDFRIFDPSSVHHYQPSWTMIGGGLVSHESYSRETSRMITGQVPWERSKVTKIEPENNKIITSEGKEFTYEHLILATGIRPDFSQIPGIIYWMFHLFNIFFCK